MSKKTFRCTNKKGVMQEGVLYTLDKWEMVNGHVGKAERLAKEAAEEVKRREDRKQCSQDMAKKWDNTYENLRKKRLQARIDRLERAKARKYERFNKIQKDKQEMKEAVRKEVRQRMYEEKDSAKTALSSYKFAETLRERKLQEEFNAKCKEEEEERERLYVKSIYDDVDAFHREELEKRKKYCENRQRLSKEAEEMFTNLEIQRREDKEKKEAEEREDLVLLRREIAQIQENEHKEKERKIQMVRKELIENRQVLEENRKVLKAEEKEEVAALDIISNAKMRMSKIRKEKEEQMKAVALERRMKLAAKVATIQEDLAGAEEARYQKARDEKEAQALKRIQSDLDNKMRLRQELIDYRNDCVKQDAIDASKAHEIDKWRMLQRYKAEEVNKAFFDLVEQKRRRKILETRFETMQQMEIEKLRRTEEKQMDSTAMNEAKRLWNLDDEAFFKFVEELKEESGKVGRPTFPLDRAVCEYKKRHGLLEIPPQHEIWKSNVPLVDTSKKKKEDKDQFRVIYTKMGNAKNPNRRPDVIRSPIEYVKDLKNANGLQDGEKKPRRA